MNGVRNRMFAPLVLVPTLAALVLAACGSEGRKGGETTTGTTTQDSRTAEQLAVGPSCGPGQRTVVAAPAEGLYHAAMPSLLDAESRDEEAAAQRVRSFERLAGRRLAWVYFSDNWFRGIEFPAAAVQAVRDAGAMPFIRLMPRSSWEERRADPRYPLDRIASGAFDADLARWARAARETRIPMLVDFGPEMNGDWFPWSGLYAGGAERGPQTYKAAFRHVVDVFRKEGATNVGFAFHANVRSAPREPWNDLAQYYPGDEYVDWIGISAYGGVLPGFDWEPLSHALDEVYPKLTALSPTKPIAILETGVIEEQGKNKAAWIRAAYRALGSGKYPRVKAAVWWHERWVNQDDRPSDVRIDSDPAAAAAYRRAIAGGEFVTRPEYACAAAAG
jgi:glycosyl hydrolase family 26